jgi:hypothetical protein
LTGPVFGMLAPFAAALCAAGLSGCADDRCDPPASASCEWEDDACTPAPSTCRRSRPEFNTLELRYSTPLPVRVEVYRGKEYETGTLAWRGAPASTTTGLSLGAGDYAVTALYVRAGDSTLVVSGGALEAAALETCDGTCYGSGSLSLDLSLAH